MFSKSLLVLGPSTVLFDEWLTTDGGRSWRHAPNQPGDPLESVPDGWLLVDGGSMWTVDPATGGYHRLSHQPVKGGGDVVSPPNGVVRPAADGSYWVVHRDTEGKTVLATTHDRGRTWSTKELAGSLEITLVASLDGRAGYAVTGARGQGKAAGWRTTDGGASWTGPYEVAGIKTPVGLVVLRDGSLLGMDVGPPPASGTPLASRDGRSFTVRQGLGIAGHPELIDSTLSGGYTVRSRGDISVRLWYSDDGKAFSAVPIPPNSQ